MTSIDKSAIAVAAMVAITYFFIRSTRLNMASTADLQSAAEFIEGFEGFTSTPYYDVSRYSWGYGTAAPGATGTITRDRAHQEVVDYITHDLFRLSSRLEVPLTANQWSALLSFSYNLGAGNAYHIIDTLNSNDYSNLSAQWASYNHAGGAVSAALTNRRRDELALFFSV